MRDETFFSNFRVPRSPLDAQDFGVFEMIDVGRR